MQNPKCWLRFLTWWNCKTRGGQRQLAATAKIYPIRQGFAIFEDQVKTYIKCAWIFWWSYQASGWLTQCSLMCAVRSVTLKSWAGIEWKWTYFIFWSEIFGFARVEPEWLGRPLFDGAVNFRHGLDARVSWLKIQTYVFTCVLPVSCLLNVIRLRQIQNILTPSL